MLGKLLYVIIRNIKLQLNVKYNSGWLMLGSAHASLDMCARVAHAIKHDSRVGIRMCFGIEIKPKFNNYELLDDCFRL